jgi:hypothetical protein
MRERQPGDRLRVIIAGNIYAKRALVRRFLEDDGFEVAAETLSASELLSLPDLDLADALVVDADLLNGSIDVLRAVAPDAAIVVFTTGATDARARPPGADAYLEKGVGLASLTALLHSLLSEASTSLPGFEWGAPVRPQQSERRILAGLGGVAAAIVLTAVAALAVFGGAAPVPTPSPVPQPTGAPGGATTSPPSAIELAMADLHDLRDALAADRTVEARSVLDRLEGELLSAEEAGFSIATFDLAVARLLQPILGEVAPSLLDDLRGLFGPILDFTTIAGGSDAGGTGLIGGVTSGTTSSGSISGSTTTTGSGGGGDTTAGGGGGDTTTGGGGTGGGGGGGGGGTEGGGGGTDGGGTGGDTSGGSDTGGEAPAAHGHGQGHHYGWANKPPEGGWHGTKPHPQGGGDPPSSDENELHPGASGHGHAK